jgi:hypothetical protein
MTSELSFGLWNLWSCREGANSTLGSYNAGVVNSSLVNCNFFCNKRRPGVDVMIIIFGDFCQFSTKKIGVFLKNQCYDHFFQKLAVVWAKTANIFAKFFGENIFKIITPVPVYRPADLHNCQKSPKVRPIWSPWTTTMCHARNFLPSMPLK